MKSLDSKIKKELNGDFLHSGLVIYGLTKIEKLITFETKINSTKFSIRMDYAG